VRSMEGARRIVREIVKLIDERRRLWEEYAEKLTSYLYEGKSFPRSYSGGLWEGTVRRMKRSAISYRMSTTTTSVLTK